VDASMCAERWRLIPGGRKRSECLLLAQSGHALVHCKCLLSRVKRTCPFALQMSAYDPKRTLRLPTVSRYLDASSTSRCVERPQMDSLQSQTYPLGGTSTERDRLLRQAEQFEPTANWLLDQIAIQPGCRVVDIGCGPIGILNLLSKRVGPRGAVIGVER